MEERKFKVRGVLGELNERIREQIRLYNFEITDVEIGTVEMPREIFHATTSLRYDPQNNPKQFR